MAKKIVNTDIYNLSQLVDDVKSVFLPDETDETLAIGTYGYIGALEAHRLQTQAEMTGELCNEVFPSRARLTRNVITHAIMTNINDINAVPAKMTAFLAIKEDDILNYFDKNNIFIVDRECPIYVGDFEFHLEYDIKLKKIYIEKKKSNAYTAQYVIPQNRDVPTSKINSNNQYLNPPAVVMVNHDSYIYLTVILSQVEHHIVSKKLVTSNIIDNKTMNFEFENQLAYFEIHVKESDQDYYLTPVFEGSSVPESNAKYYCWYQYIDTDLIRVRFDRHSFMPGLNATVECLIKTCRGNEGNFTYADSTFIELESESHGYKGVTALLTPVSDSMHGKDMKSKRELQSLIPKEALSRGSLTTITDLNNYFGMLDDKDGRIIIQKKIDNQIERVYYAYFVAKDKNMDVIPSNTVDIEVGIEDLIKSSISETDSPRYLLPSGQCFRLGDDGIARINHLPLLGYGYEFNLLPSQRGDIITIDFDVRVTEDAIGKENVSCAVDLNGNPTPTHVFPPKNELDKFHAIRSKENTEIVEDYMQMGVGKSYTYTADYITKEDNSLITAWDLKLGCFDIEDAYYTVNEVTVHFKELPIVAYEFPAGTRIHFGIERRLNTKIKGIITFNHEDKFHRLNQKRKTLLSAVLKGLGTLGRVTNAVSMDESVVKLEEYGLIEDHPVGPEVPDIPDVPLPPVELEDPFTKFVVDSDFAPNIEDRHKNEWYWIIEDKKLITSADNQDSIVAQIAQLATEGIEITDESDITFILHVMEEQDLPPIEQRKENEWYYVITERDNDTTLIPFVAGSKTHKVHIVTEKTLPPVGKRGTKDDWYLVVTKAYNDPSEGGGGIDPDNPDKPTSLTGKDYKVEVLRHFEDPVNIVVTLVVNEKEGTTEEYIVTLNQDRFDMENSIIVAENGKEVLRDDFLTYVSTLDQNKWPDNLVVDDIIHYKFRFKSSGLQFYPDIMIKLSRGLEYVPFSNYVTYPGKEPILYEPRQHSLEREVGFIYTNPYAVNINGYRLYSAFYMMSMDENPYLHFEYINDKSNVQFIATNIHWGRQFYGNSKTYEMSITLTQSVQDNIGLINEDDITATPLVKAVAVFYRDNKPYRYRSLNLTSFDPELYTFTFEQSFDSLDIFDNENNIKVTNTQVTTQIEYKITLSYNDKSVEIMTGGKTTLSTLSKELGINITGEIEAISSENRMAIEVYPIMDEHNHIIDANIVSFNDFEEPTKINIMIKYDAPISIDVTSTTINPKTEYGFFNPNTTVKIYTFSGIPDIEGNYTRYDFDYICPGMKKWNLTNIYNVVNGVTLYHNYSEIMGSRVTPYGKKFVDSDNNEVMKLEGFKVKNIPMLGYDYCQDEILVQNAIDALNHRKAYIDNAMIVLENSFGIDFKLFNTYGPSRTFYVIKDIDKNRLLDDNKEFIDRVNLTLYFRIKLVAYNDSYTKNNIIQEIKDYIEDLDDLTQLHIPNLVAQITSNYKEQVSYFEYLGFNNYGADIQHIYKLEDEEIPIHVAPEFLCVNNVLDGEGITSPDINISISEI